MAWICDKNGNHRCEIKQLSYNGTFMGVSSITVTVESPAPIAFAIGDYIDWDYDGLRYTLDTAAGVEKQARRNSVGNAFLYENLVFLSPLQAAQNADFFDVILGNTNDFLTNTEFSFYGTAWDYAKRLEANLCRLYGSGTWKVRIWTNGTCYDATPATGIGTGAWENKLVDVSGIKCLGGFQQIYDLWGCAYVFSVVSGVNYVDFYDDFEQYAKAWQAGGMDKIFAYGKGNGLYKIRHTPDADHVLVTRLRPYGSGDNIPANYYLNSEDYHIEGNESSELAISHLMLPASQWTKDGIKHPSNAYLEQNTDLYGVREGVMLWDGSDPELGEIKPSIYRLSIQDLLDLMAAGDSYRPDEAKWPDTTQRIDKIITGAVPTDNGVKNEAGYDFTEIESSGSLAEHSFGTGGAYIDVEFNDLVMGTTPSVSHLAEFRIVPTSENKVAASFDVQASVASAIRAVNAYLTPYVGGVKISDATYPCTVTEEAISNTVDGITYTKRYKISLLDSTGNPIVFSSMYTGDVTFRIVAHIDFIGNPTGFPVVRNEYAVSFNLVRGNKAIDEYFSVTIPQIGFDLAAAVANGAKLCMRSGANQPREFAIVPSSVRYLPDTDTWYVRCKRSVDQSISTYFPNSNSVIATGDEYYLTGIVMPPLYVEIAAQKLLTAATAWLNLHSKPRMLSAVDVDNKIMAVDGIVLKEGMSLPISDTDLGIQPSNQESRVIDNIRIEEGTDAIRTFSVTLRDKKEKSALDAAIRGATSNFATASSVNEAVNKVVNTSHDSLTGRDMPNQHPISAITGLEDALLSSGFFEIGSLSSLVQLKAAYSYLGTRLGLLFDVTPEADVASSPAHLMLRNLGTAANPNYALYTPLPLITGGDQIIGNGTPGGGGSGGGAGYLYELGDIYHDNDKTKVLRPDGQQRDGGDVLSFDSALGVWVALPGNATQTWVSQQISALNLGAAATYGVASSVSQNDNTHLVTGAAVWTAIDNLPEPMVFKGSLGVGGTIQALPVNGSASIGDTYKVITAGTYAGKTAKVGDTFICDSKGSSTNTWTLIPSGDEPEGTVTSVGISLPVGLALGNGSTNPITAAGTFNIEFSSGYSIPLTADVTKGVTAYGYFDASGNAKSALKLTTVNKSAWGQTYWTPDGVPTSISGDMSSVGNVTPSANKSKNLGSSTALWAKVYSDKYYLTDSIYFYTETVNNVMCVHLNAPFITDGDQIVISGTPGSGGGGAMPYMRDIQDVSLSATVGNGDLLQWNGSAWVNVAANTVGGVTSVVNQTGDVTVTQIADALTAAGYKLTDTVYTLPLAANGTRGGIQIGYSSSGKNYAVQLSSEKAYVNVPWTDTTYKLTLNGTAKGTTGGTDLGSFYAPTGGGTANQVLIAGGNNTAPSWTNQSNLSVGTASKLGSATVGWAHTKPIYLNNGTPTVVSHILANILTGGLPSIGNTPYFVGVNPVFNYNAYAVDQGAEVKFYLDDVELVQTSSNSAKYLFDGLSNTYITPFDMRRQSTYVDYDASHQYIVGELCSYTPSGATKTMWYRCTTACSGKVPTDTSYWEDVSASGTYSGVDPSKFTSFKIVIKNLPKDVRFENGMVLYWRTSVQRPNYVSVRKIDVNDVYTSVVTDQELIGPADTVYLGYGGGSAAQKGVEITLTGFTLTSYWNLALIQIAFTGIGGSIDGTMLLRGGGTVFGAISPYSNNLTTLGTSSLRWSTVYATALNLNGAITGATTGAFSSNVTIGGTLGVTGATTLSSTLAVAGLATLSGGATIPSGKTLKIGDATIEWIPNSGNGYLKINKPLLTVGDQIVNSGTPGGGGGGGGASSLFELADVLTDANKTKVKQYDGTTNAANGNMFAFNGSKWYALKLGTNLSITNGTLNATNTTYSNGTGLALSNGVFSITSAYQTNIANGASAYSTLTTSQTKNKVLASPSNASGAPSFRALVAADLPSIENLTNFSTRVYDATTSRTANYVLAAPNGSNGAATFRKLVAADIPSLTVSKISDIASNYVSIATANTITAKHTFSNGILLNTASSWTNSERAIAFSADGEDANIRYYYTDSNKGLTFNPSTGELRAAKFIKRGGTSDQFLKADGSVDSNTYLTGNQTITLSGDVSGSGTTSINVSIGSGKVTNAMLAGSIAWSKLSVSASNITSTLGTTAVSRATADADGNTISSTYVKKAGDTMSGDLIIEKTGGGLTIRGDKLNANADGGYIYLAARYSDNERNGCKIAAVYPGSGAYDIQDLVFYSSNNRSGNAEPIWQEAMRIKADKTVIMSGWLSVSRDGVYNIYTNNTASDGTASGIRFQLNGTTKGGLFVSSDENLYYSVGTATTGNRVLTSANYDSFALPLSAGSSYPLTGHLYLNEGLGIQAVGGVGLLVYHPTPGWSGIDSTQWGLGSVNSQGVIRSSNSNLLHYKGSTSYSIWDASNSGISTMPWACSTLSVNTSLTLPNDVSILGTLTDSTTASMIKMSTSNNIVVGSSSFAHNVNLYGTLVKFYAGGTTAIGTVSSTGLDVTGTVTASGIGTFDRVVLSNSGAVSHIEFTRAGWNYVSVPTDGVIAFNVGGSGSANTSMAVTPDGICAGTKGVHSCGLPTAYWGSIYGKDLYLGGDAYNTAAGSIIFSEKLDDLRNGFKIAPVHATSANRVNLVFYRSNNGNSPWAANWTTLMTLSYDGKVTIAGSLTTSGDQVISSDASLKKNWRGLKYGVADIAKATAGVFDWKDGKGESAGTKAQDWMHLVPQLVHGEEGHMTLAYGQIAMLNTILLARRSEDHETRIKALELENAELKKEIERLKS